MSKQEECSKCKRAKQGGYAGEIKCSFYGRKPLFDDSPCSNFLNVNIKCPECGQEVPTSEKVCPNCGCPLKEASPQEKKNIQSDNIVPNTTPNTTKKSDMTLLYTRLLILGIVALIGFSVYFISNGGDDPQRYTIKLSNDYSLPWAQDITVYECDENGDKFYDNKFSLKQRGESKTFTAQPRTKKIKVLVTWEVIDLSWRHSYPRTESDWLPLVYYLSPEKPIVIEIGNRTSLSPREP